MKPLVLVGPTASGKSAVALEIARVRSDVELVSADSMQVYRGMDLGTAKPTSAEQAEVRHHLIDLVDPSAEYSVAEFQSAVCAVLDDVARRGRRAVLVGGTGLYLRSVIDRFTLPGRWPEVKAELEVLADTDELYRRLVLLDATAAARMEPTNRRRIVRALEVCLGSGKPFSSFGPGLDDYPPVPFEVVGLRWPRPHLDARIAARVDAMLAAGFLDEVRSLRSAGDLSKTARQALGYRELLVHLEDGVPLDECIAEVVRRTRRFARRQEAWFRRDPRIRWMDVDEHDNPLAVAQRVLGDWEYRCPPKPSF